MFLFYVPLVFFQSGGGAALRAAHARNRFKTCYTATATSRVLLEVWASSSFPQKINKGGESKPALCTVCLVNNNQDQAKPDWIGRSLLCFAHITGKYANFTPYIFYVYSYFYFIRQTSVRVMLVTCHTSLRTKYPATNALARM